MQVVNQALYEKWLKNYNDFYYDNEGCTEEPELDTEAEPSDLRIFSVWCANRVKHLMQDQRSLKALEIAIHYLDNKILTQEDITSCRTAINNAEKAWDDSRRFSDGTLKLEDDKSSHAANCALCAIGGIIGRYSTGYGAKGAARTSLEALPL